MLPHQRVVIIGGGFAGLNAAVTLRHEPVDVTLIDRRNYHLFQPLLYQVATGGLSPANISAPLRAVLKRQRNTTVLMAEVLHIDMPRQAVILPEEEVPYDVLIVATGSSHDYFGHAEWERHAPSLKTIEDATDIRRRVLSAFEAAEREPDVARREAFLTFVVVGGGPTGVELAGAVAELAHQTLRGNFRHFEPATARIVLVEGVDRVLPSYTPKLSAKAAESLAALRVEVRTSTFVTDLCADSVTLKHGDHQETVSARTVLWAAGVSASPLGRVLADECGATLDRAGRVVVDPDLSIPGRPDVFVIGDLARYDHQTGEPLPGLAPVAMQQGRYVARVLQRRRAGKPIAPFHYRDKGTMATIGRAKAVVDLRGWQFSGFFAWVTWLFVHLMFLIQFSNRVLVMLQWAWHYTTRNSPARLITGGDPYARNRASSSKDIENPREACGEGREQPGRSRPLSDSS